ncbi:ATP-grasp domain-containing protein [Salipiger aestuarii]|uniref:ATP-grasp domain-containing protein n=1 Tax=Salipiger aestuarii TaxID=568098 RepID=UPI00123B95B1|nr:hypothetical protein [Salipiger aestuarii]KAA8616448.1 hypothetical protein AL037_00690 [Salipiger aestuarii]
MEPQNRVGVAQLTNLALQGVDLNPLRCQLLRKCIEGEDHAAALMDLSVIDQLYGDLERGLAWQARAFETCTLFRTDRGRTGVKTLLVFALPVDIGSNTPIEFLVTSDEFEIVTCYLNHDSAGGATAALPDHDVAFCAAPADAEDALRFSQTIRRALAGSGTKVLNLHDPSVDISRLSLQHQLPRMDGLRLPAAVSCDRPTLTQLGPRPWHGTPLQPLGDYPVVIRPVGSHAGRGLEKLDDADDMASYLARQDDAEFHLGQFIDYASPHDGRFRKCRIAFIDGVPYPCHLAIAERWDVWYTNARMEESAEKRAEESAFLDAFDHDFARRHAAGLDAIADSIGMDYFGIDCAEDRHGNLVVFEADNSLIVHDLECKTTFPYKGKHMQRVFSAFEDMLRRACKPS